MKTLKLLLMIMAVVVASAFVAQAKTIALWPIEYDSTLTTFDGSSAIMPGDSLSIYTDDTTVSGVTAGVRWNLPPNLGSDKFLFDPINRTAIMGTLGAPTDAKGMTMRCTSANVVNHLYPTNDFTLEGWFMMKEYKTDNWTIFLQQGMGSSHASGWFVSLTGLATEGARRFNLCANNATVAFENLTAAEEVAFTNQWHHFALTCKYDYNATQSAWTMYLDGVSKGTIIRPLVTSVNNSHQAFEFGGRYNSKSNRFFGGFDYWRLSDEVLEPSQFLNAGGAGTVIPEPAHTTSTIAYWKLGTNADGTLDGSDYVGSADLSDGLHDLPTTTSGFFSGMVPSSESAFSGNPPNPTVTLSSPNSGSALSLPKTGSSASAKNGTVLVVSNLGSELSFGNDFTVEGWIKPRWKTGTAGNGYLLGTRFDGNGWVLGVNASNQAYIYAQDGSGTFHNSTAIGTMPASWLEKWTHIALVYSAATGNGTWSLYADGVLLGTLANPRTSTASNATFRLGGRETNDWTFKGNYDCFRVSRAALSPSQFLCAANGTAATSVLALWPLDTPDGVSWDLRDETGNYTLRTLRSANYRPVADASAPTVTNPDTSEHFNGCAASTHGSVAFCSADGSARTRSFLTTSDPSVMAAISSKNGFTIEGYFKRAADPAGVEYVFMTQTGALSSSTWQQHQSGFYYSANGFAIRDAKFSNFGNGVSGAFAGTGDQPVGEWRHFALTYQGVESLNANNQTVLTSTWKLYVNGTLSGTLSRSTLGPADSNNPRWLVFGSRPHSGDAFRGSLSSVRISNAVLEPGQFLCDVGTLPVATAPETLAYWPLDSADGTALDLAAKTEPVGYSFYYYTAAAVGGSSERAIGSLPGGGDAFLPRTNTGSVTLAGGSSDYMRTAYLGRRLALDGDFTVEGWFKWNATARGRRNVLAGTYDVGAGKGWRLEIDDMGDAPRFRIFARSGKLCSPLVDATFWTCIVEVGKWNHVALSYNPHVGRGTWTLRQNGKDVGTVENLWRDDSLVGASDTFALGNYCDTLVGGFEGAYDLWRASKGFVATENLIWRPHGMTIIVR